MLTQQLSHDITPAVQHARALFSATNKTFYRMFSSSSCLLFSPFSLCSSLISLRNKKRAIFSSTPCSVPKFENAMEPTTANLQRNFSSKRLARWTFLIFCTEVNKGGGAVKKTTLDIPSLNIFLLNGFIFFSSVSTNSNLHSLEEGY